MTEVDERILETVSVYDRLKLYPLHERIGRESTYDPPVSYILLRCKRLREYGLLAQQGGLFFLTEMGYEYLDGELDAERLTPTGRSDERSRICGSERTDP